MRTLVTTAAAAMLLVLLQGCGHKAPLFLPQAPAAPSQPTQNK